MTIFLPLTFAAYCIGYYVADKTHRCRSFSTGGMIGAFVWVFCLIAAAITFGAFILSVNPGLLVYGE